MKENWKEELEAYKAYDYNVAHELKNPIAASLVLAQSLLESNADIETYREFLRDICVELQRENDIIQDLLLLAGLEKENAKYEEAFPVRVVKNSIREYEAAAGQKNIGIRFSFGQEAEEVRLRGGERLFFLIVKNYLENAIRYQDSGGRVKIALKLKKRKGKEMLFLTVRDYGAGIEKKDQERIFERFYRVDKNLSRENGGTGLGLSITAKAAKLMGGFAGVESRPGKGSIFYAMLPSEN